ncbi:carbohydrate ABC transporter substrate-binding protein, CUT1 family [Sphingomonas gellani]|uniref:Carbohydrate ABC transporter substrate-binding protein, CUT1 family n=1 Tax=Sphingomonas gellani TaxID=1166340 RepID=A0A1H8I162_9SPHN|nr:ABC transporter substrate-binding protein [Sphingomonas gellani]SEN61991.1 carbohydrate ABC transporter substrate-binding protein, CUT1 family [Sphingomonas gellani]
MERRDLLRLGVGGAALLAGCAPQSRERRSDVIRLWVAPNDAEEGFWKVAVARWNALRRGLPVTFTTIPTAGSSEDTVLSALVAGTEPDLCTNIFSGFAVQLAALKQVVDLAALPGFAELVARRRMEAIVPGWTQGGRVCALPIYSSPTLIWWRADLLEANGLSHPPRTYDEVYQFSARYGRPGRRYGMQVVAGRDWRDRWFDFISFYYAVSGGLPYLDGAHALYDNRAGLEAATFMDRMFRRGWTAPDFDAEEPLVSGLAAGAVRGPWDVERFARIYPQTLARIAVGPMIAREAATANSGGGPTSTFSDSKGVVIFRSSRVTRQAFDFLAWVLGDEALNLLWLRRTGLSPARSDLLTNPRFAEYYRTNPLVRTYAEHVASARPPALSEYTIDIQKIMSSRLVEPLMTGQATPADALARAVGDTDRMLAAQA